MLGDDFVEALKWLGREGFSFDLGVDARQGGLWQLEEAVEMMQKVFTNNASGPKIVISWSYLPLLLA
jgi:L-rhamnono-1,4-lactonase